MKLKRSYMMQARAASADATRQRILETAVELLKTRFRSEIRLEKIAMGAQVSVQTVLNVFGSRAALLNRAMSEFLSALRAQRLLERPGDVEGCIQALIEHYEQFGDLVARNLAEQIDVRMLEVGRTGHRKWVERQFAPQLAGVVAKEKRTLVDALVCACDVYVWKLLRRDMGRSRSETEATVLRLVGAVLSSV